VGVLRTFVKIEKGKEKGLKKKANKLLNESEDE
jgi:hypothetical protein